MRKLLALLLLFPGTAFAVAPELCGSGLDEPGNTMGTANGTFGSCPAGYGYSISGTGCDLLCPGADQDNDGYTSNGQLGTAGSTAIDCDDTNKFVFPGVWTAAGCTGGQIHQCHATNGTYSSCVAQSAITCEATGSGVCYHVDCTSGNDANAGTYAAPFRTLAKVSGGSGGSGLPASPVTLAAGDVVYVRGTLCSTTMTSSGSGGFSAQNVIGEFASNGTLANKITIKALPGNTPIVYTTNGVGFSIRGNHTKIQGLWFATALTSAANATGVFSVGDYTTVDSCFFLGMGGNGGNNDACIYYSATAGGKAFRNVFKDCKEASAVNRTNMSAINWIDTNGDPTQCFDHEAKWNGIVYTTLGDGLNGNAFMVKHGCEQADVGVNKHPIQYNRIANPYRVLRWEGSSLRFSGNIAVQAEETARIFVDSASVRHQDNEITDNTFVDMSKLAWDDPLYTTPEKLTLLRNVFRDNSSGYVGSNHDGVISISGYGTAPQKVIFETSPYYLSSNNNCFYNGVTTLTWSYFSDGSGAVGPKTFAQWKALPVSYDAASFVENPTFNAYYGATSANCLNKGIQFPALNIVPQGTTNTGRGMKLLRWRRNR